MSTLRCYVAGDEDSSEWQLFVASKDAPHCYFDIRWKAIIEKSFRRRCYYLMAKDDAKVKGVMPLGFIDSRIYPKHMVSLPYFNYGGILAEDAFTESFLFDEACRISKEAGADLLEIRGLRKIETAQKTREHKVTMWLDIASGPSMVWEAIGPKKRNQVRKAQKSGLNVNSGGAGLLDDFYRVFSENMRDLGTPVLDKVFFHNMLMVFPEETRIFVVKKGDRPLAAGFTVSSGKMCQVPWASSLRKYNQMCPNDLLYWSMIEYASSNGYAVFDFGRCTKNTGTYHFKKNWEAKEVQLYWQYWSAGGRRLPLESPAHGRGTLVNIWKKLPLSVANALGPRIARELPFF
jgi:FemAB-related protein (PEP-CTERM system-associated)